jgi:2-polyprenyl-3-methyl-5-hydroxy-6-metoxy-1,4-benzoquinol methylase
MTRCYEMENMIEDILATAKDSTYDFRETAFPEDPLRHLFSDWVSYYRMKWAISRVLEPKTILEIGVRFGYSALAFLNASPSARYLGIDLDSPAFGGTVGAIDWARKACNQYRAQFLIADSTKLDRFPGERYDLIHVDGQQDGDGTMNDLVLAAAQAEYILVDGYFWSRQNFLWASEFLYRYRDLIEYYHVIPGYAGELLIRMKAQDISAARSSDSSSGLRTAYTKEYYLFDCEGHEAFKRSAGAKLEDARLEAVAKLVGAGPVNRALDLGCGRGELSLELARRGFEVTAIDYSEDAVQITKEAINRSPNLARQISVQCNDVNAAEFGERCGIAVAVDLIEHMEPGELDKLYRKVADHLALDGLFIVHTYPNLWYYKYEYSRKLRVAKQIGAYLPTQPRSRYELLMHINEQSPRVLKRQLRNHFPNVVVWFGKPENVGENLERKFSISEMRAAPDLFAIASHSPISLDKLLAEIRMKALDEKDIKGLEITIKTHPPEMRTGSHYPLTVELWNDSLTDLKSVAPYPIHLAYHWMNLKEELLVLDGERTHLSPDSKAGSKNVYEMTVASPAESGTYLLRVTLVQERIRWFDQIPGGVYCDLKMVCH